MFDALPLRIIPALVMGALTYFMCGLQWSLALFFHYLLILVLFHCTTTLICFCISSVVLNTSLANLVAIMVLTFFALFQGILLNFGTRRRWAALARSRSVS